MQIYNIYIYIIYIIYIYNVYVYNVYIYNVYVYNVYIYNNVHTYNTLSITKNQPTNQATLALAKSAKSRVSR